VCKQILLTNIVFFSLNKRIAHTSVWFGRDASCLHLQVAKSNIKLLHLSIKSLCEEVILTGNNVNVFLCGFCIVYFVS